MAILSCIFLLIMLRVVILVGVSMKLIRRIPKWLERIPQQVVTTGVGRKHTLPSEVGLEPTRYGI